MTIAWVVIDEFSTNGLVYRRGTVLNEAERSNLVAFSALLLPVDEDQAESAAQGAHRWDWGEGWNWDGSERFGCPMTIWVPARGGYLYWTAEFFAGTDPSGEVVLGVQSGRSDGTLSVGLKMLDDRCGFEFRIALVGYRLVGRTAVSSTVSGFAALALQGSLRGARCLWSAVSFCSELVQS